MNPDWLFTSVRPKHQINGVSNSDSNFKRDNFTNNIALYIKGYCLLAYVNTLYSELESINLTTPAEAVIERAWNNLNIL